MIRHLIGILRPLLVGAAIGAALVIAGTMDAEDAERDHAATCSMIEAGDWPAEVEPSCKRGRNED